MSKEIKIVSVSLMTRVTVDSNATEAEILDAAKANFHLQVDNELGEHLDQIIQDNSIVYKGIEYPTRTFNVFIPDEGVEREITISTQSLSDAMGEDKEDDETEGGKIDCDIYFYVEDRVIYMNASVICWEHLDTPITFLSED